MISTVENAPIAGLLQEVEHIFSEKGVLSRSPNFEFRPQQQQMAIAVGGVDPVSKGIALASLAEAP